MAQHERRGVAAHEQRAFGDARHVQASRENVAEHAVKHPVLGQCLSHACEHGELGFKLVGFVDDRFASSDAIGHRGLPVLGQTAKGDLIVRVHVWTPERLTAEQERLFRELATLEGEPPKRSPGFWSKLKEALGA